MTPYTVECLHYHTPWVNMPEDCETRDASTEVEEPGTHKIPDSENADETVSTGHVVVTWVPEAATKENKHEIPANVTTVRRNNVPTLQPPLEALAPILNTNQAGKQCDEIGKQDGNTLGSLMPARKHETTFGEERKQSRKWSRKAPGSHVGRPA